MGSDGGPAKVRAEGTQRTDRSAHMPSGTGETIETTVVVVSTAAYVWSGASQPVASICR